MTDSTAADIRRTLTRVVIATVAIYLALAVAGGAAYWLADQQRNNLRAEEARTTTALCSFYDDLNQRVTSTQDYLTTHPADTIFGVPRATIVTNLNNQQRTLRSLAALRCP